MNARLSKELQALDAHLKKQNREASKQWAELPPMPADPMVCRWCGSRRREIVSASENAPAVIVCNAGCAANDDAPFVHQCPECHRQFTSGRTREDLCYECDRREHEAMTEGYRSPGRHYEYQRIRRGGYRE